MSQLHGVKDMELCRILESWSWGWMLGRLRPYGLLGDDDLMIYPSGLLALCPNYFYRRRRTR
jgi:hypothetical protein